MSTDARHCGMWGAAIFAALFAVADARASLKTDGSPPLAMPNTLLVETGGRRGPVPAKMARRDEARAVADMKSSPRICSAVAVQIPHRGTRIVTARHCADHRDLEVLDDEHEVTPVDQIDAAGDVDLAVLEVRGRMPWPGLEMSPAASVPVGERLCAWRMHRGLSGIVRERICARLVRREERPGALPLLVMSHPYPAGTSGSALVDRRGRVVGIVVASTGVLGLAEPIEGVLKIAAPVTNAAEAPSQSAPKAAPPRAEGK